MYFFWISVSQIYSGYIAQEDYSFTAMLPVSKKDIANSKALSLFIVEGLHVVTGLILGIVHNLIYGSTNFFLDINFAFFGIVLVMYSLFNIIFLPLYFKSAYYFGKPVIYGVVITLIYAFIMEYGVIKYEFMRNIFEGTIYVQTIVLIIGIVLTVILNYIAVVKSRKNYESII
jgi:hypothetical protein